MTIAKLDTPVALRLSRTTSIPNSTCDERYYRIVEKMRDLVSEVDGSGAYTYASPSYKTVLGYDPNDLIGKIAFEQVHPDDVHATLIAFDRAMKRQSPGQAQYRFRMINGEYIWLETVGNVVVDNSGNAVGAVFSSRDVNARVLAEQRLEAKRTLLEGIFDSTGEEVLSLDTSGAYTSFNKQHAAMMQRLGGVTIQLGGSFLKYLADIETLSVARLIVEKGLQGKQWTAQFSREDGTSNLRFEISSHPILHKSNTVSGVAVFIKDITGRAHI